jgi:hypothetical protein
LETVSDSNDEYNPILSKRMHGSVKTVNNPEKEMLEINSLSEKKVKRKTAEILKCPHPN